MHPADIVAAVKKRGTTMVALSRHAGLSDTAIRVALRHPFLKAETALIRFLGLPPHLIWPDRYDPEGERLVRRGRPRRPGSAIITRRRRNGQRA